MKTESPRFLHIGAGWWGQRWIRAILDRDDCVLAGVVDARQEAIDSVVDEFDLDCQMCSTDYRKALKETDADTAVILVPPAMHKEVAIAALEAGLNILMEKPLAVTWLDALEIYASWCKHGQVPFMISQTRRWSDHIAALKRFMESGRLGNVGMINIDYRTHRNFTDWRVDMKFPVLEDMSAHHFDSVRYLIGAEAVNVFCKSFKTPWEWFSGCSASSAIVEMTGRAVLNYSSCWTTQGRETKIGRAHV